MDSLEINSDEENYQNNEDELNKAIELARIDEEVIRKQKEIELLLRKKQKEKEALLKNREKEEERKKELKKKRREQQRIDEEKQLEYEKKLQKRHILQNRQPQIAFADKLAGVHRQHRQELEEQKLFFKARKYAFGLEGNGEIEVIPRTVDEKESFSGQQLSKRYIEDDVLKEVFQSKKVLRVNQLFQKVHPPDFEEPKYPNWVLVGIIVAKTEAETAPSSKPWQTKPNRPNKYTKITISDFILSVNLMLFDGAHQKYHKLQVGDVVGILNPMVSPRRDRQTGQCRTFTLTLSTGYEAIIEIGKSKNFGLCKGTRRGNLAQCTVPVDKSKTEYCEYHQNMTLKNITANRLELGGLSTSGGLNKTRGMIDKNSVLMNLKYKTNDSKSFGIQVFENHYASRFTSQDDLNTGKVYFSNVNSKRAFFDDEYTNPDTVSNIDPKRRKIESKKKEMELRKKLSTIKGGESLANELPVIEKDSQYSRDEVKRNVQVLKAAYAPETINQLGFDPTVKVVGMQSTAASVHLADILDQRGRAKKTIESLDAIRKRKKIHLSPSRESKIKRTKKWSTNINQMKRYDTEVQKRQDNGELAEVQKRQDYGELFTEDLSSTPSSAFSSPAKDKQEMDVDTSGKRKLTFTKQTITEDSSSDDSELDIDFGGNEHKYYAAIGGKK